jgi:hypothetical protein
MKKYLIHILVYIGLLIAHGTNELNNITLSTSGQLNILALNSFGIYASINISVQVISI